MNANRLLAAYDRVAETPGAIARVRRLVLDLAVRGKLTAQDPADEPARELLPWAGEGRGSEAGLPMNWCRAPLGDLLVFRYGKALPARERTEEGPVPVYGSNGIVAYTEKPLSVQPCVVVGRKGSAGALNKCIGPSWTTDVAYFVEVPDFLHVDFLFVALSTLDLNSLAKGVKPGLSRSDAYTKCIRVPPLAEQHRIVRKVDELMALCDRLNEAYTAREEMRDRLTSASLVRLTEPNGDAAVSRAHARFLVDALPVVTARANQIKHLRQAILNLAVRGKLVPQEASDEPASELLKRIRADKRKREPPHNRGRSQSAKVPSDDWPYEVPSTWTWATLGEITISRDGERVPVSKVERRGRAKIYDYYGASGVIDKIDGYLFDSPLLLIGEDGANLINRSTPIAFMARGKYWVNNHAHVLDGLTEQLLRYLEIFVNATDLAPFVTGTAQPKMNKTRMNSIPVALPPLDEQLQIVAKVDELMALCDRLEVCLGTIDITKSHLLDSILREAVDTEGE